jgi:hypothetical protein
MLIYGASLYHRAKGHVFASTYLFWSFFYVLYFGYVLSYQLTFVYLWSQSILETLSGFILVSLIIGGCALAYGIYTASNENKIRSYELWGILATIFVLVAFMLIASPATQDQGVCTEKYCYSLNSESSCNAINHCAWTKSSNSQEGYCNDLRYFCSSFYTNESCTSASTKGVNCVWTNESNFDSFNEQYYCKNPNDEKTSNAVMKTLLVTGDLVITAIWDTLALVINSIREHTSYGYCLMLHTSG